MDGWEVGRRSRWHESREAERIKHLTFLARGRGGWAGEDDLPQLPPGDGAFRDSIDFDSPLASATRTTASRVSPRITMESDWAVRPDALNRPGDLTTGTPDTGPTWEKGDDRPGHLPLQEATTKWSPCEDTHTTVEGIDALCDESAAGRFAVAFAPTRKWQMRVCG